MVEDQDRDSEARLDEKLRVLDEFPHPQCGPQLMARIHSAVRDVLSARRRRVTFIKRAVPLAAAACILLVVSFLVKDVMPGAGPIVAKPTATMASAADPIGELVNILLENSEADLIVASNRQDTADEAIPEEVDCMLWELAL